MDKKSFTDHVFKGLEKLKLKNISNSFEENIYKFFQIFTRYQKRIKLVGTEDFLEIIDSHIIDSFAVLRILPQIDTLCDVGSGAGFPGLILKMERNSLDLTLIERNQKKTYFLEVVIKELGLQPSTVINESVENIKFSSPFNCTISRAVFPLTEWLKIAAKISNFAVYMSAREIKEDFFLSFNYAVIKKDIFNLPYSDKPRVNYLLSYNNSRYPRRIS